MVVVNRYTASAAEIVSRRAAGSRPRLDSGRNHLRQGPGADGISAERKHRPGADHGALLHAQRPIDPARLFEHFVPGLLLPHRIWIRRTLTDVKMTDSGRTVYGGGGITPDEKYDAAQVQHSSRSKCSAQVRVLQFLGQVTSARTQDAKLPKGWEPDDEVDQRVPRVPAQEQKVDFHRSRFRRQSTNGSNRN